MSVREQTENERRDEALEMLSQIHTDMLNAMLAGDRELALRNSTAFNYGVDIYAILTGTDTAEVYAILDA